MENVKLDKVERNKIWEAMLEAGIIIKKPTCKKLRDEQYQLKKRLNNSNTIQSIQLMRTILFFYDKYHQSISSSDSNQKSHEEQLKDQRKLFHQKLNDKQKIMNELSENIETLKRKNASLENEIKSLKKTLLEETEEKEFYKRFKLDNVKTDNNEVKPEPDKVDCYGMSACVVKGEIVDYDE